MKLVHKEFNFIFHFKENIRSLLVVEQPAVFSKLVKEFMAQELGEESGFIFSDEDVVIKKKDKLVCIVNPLSITLNERRVLNKLDDIIKKEISSSELLIEGNKVASDLERYALHIIQNMDWNLVCSKKIDISSLLKLIGIQFDNSQETVVERLIEYMRVMHELIGTKCFVFVHLLSYLTDYEIEKFYEYVHYQKISVLLLESRQPKKVEKYGEVVIVDKDSCEIMLNMR